MIKNTILLIILIISTSAYSLPIDWNGSFDVDSTRIDNYRLGTTDVSTAGSAGIDNGNASGSTALFQTYILKLKPHIIVNDGVSIKGVLSTGNIQGEQLGSNTQFSSNNSDAGLHYMGTTAGNSALDVSQLFVELYADSALYRAGRFTRHWGLGAVANDGKNAGDRFFTVYDGIEAEYNFGKFFVTPFWAKQYTGNSHTRNTQITELGAKFLYDNPDKDLKIGALYTKRTSGGNNGALKANNTNNVGAPHKIGASTYKLLDIYFEKAVGNFTIKGEIPVVSGEAGNIYDTSTQSTYKAQAFLFDVSYKKSNTKTYGIMAGMVSGDDGTTDEFEGMFLHPNFQVAQMLYRYNLNAVGDASNQNIFESYITNSTFVKLYANIVNDNWTWNFAYIYAMANEVAENGNNFYHHEGRYLATSANGDQEQFMGHEIDISFDYQWNPNVVVTGYLGYLLTGDYFKFTNSGTDQDTKNAYTSGIKMSVSF